MYIDEGTNKLFLIKLKSNQIKLINFYRFGVCCVFLISASSGGAVSQNCTYIQNPNFPSPYTGTKAVSYTVQKSSSGKNFI
jgi:hypothetical protein